MSNSKGRACKSNAVKAKFMAGGDKNQKVHDKLMDLGIPKASKEALSKLLVSGQLTSVDEITCASEKTIIVQAKINIEDKRFNLQSDDVIIKVFINGTREEIQARMDTEWTSQIRNPPPRIVKLENMIIMSVVGEGPSSTLDNVLKSKPQEVKTIYLDILDQWHCLKLRKFEPSDFVWHDSKFAWEDSKWFLLGSGELLEVDETRKLDCLQSNLKAFVDYFINHGLTKKQASEGCWACYYVHEWKTLQRKNKTRQKKGKPESPEPVHDDYHCDDCRNLSTYLEKLCAAAD